MTETQNAGDDFGAILDAHLAGLRTDFVVGDKIEGKVAAIDRNSVFVDLGAKSEGIIERTELLDADGNVTVSVGDRVEAFCLRVHDATVFLTTKMTGTVADASLQEAYEGGIPIEGKVTSERKGGFEVQVASHSAFCPYSQIDIFKQDSEVYIGERYTFLVTEYADDGRNLVLSRRRLLERERAKQQVQLKETLRVGDVISGTVTRMLSFGVFVDLGGAEGLIHVSELAWGHGVKPEDILSAGQEVEVLVREIDWEQERISLSLKYAQGDPWEKLTDESSDYVPGKRYEGVVTQIAPFGAFVQLEPGIEGLVHVSRLGAGARVHHPDEVVSIDDKVEVSIESIDLERRRISLSMDDTVGTGIDIGDDGEAVIREGATLTGVVDGVKDFGVFVRLSGKRSGLLHISQIELRGSTNRLRALHDMFPPGSSVEVVVQQVKGDRISLTLRETLDKEAAELDLKSLQDSGGEDLGGFGNLLDGLKL